MAMSDFWGKAHTNNNIGYGSSGINNFGYGTIYDKSESGNTDLNPEINPFQDAAVAYSLRDLGLGAENVVRVRRSTDNVEQDFTSSEITDGTLTTFCGVGDGFVSVWYDQRGNSNLEQNIASEQPQIVENGNIITVNDSTALLGNDVNTNMVNNQIKNLPSSDFNMYIIGKSNAQDTNQSIGWDGNNDFYVELDSARGNINFRIFARDNVTIEEFFPEIVTGQQTLYVLSKQNGNLNIRVNGNDKGSFPFSGTLTNYDYFFLFSSRNVNSGNYTFQSVIITDGAENINKSEENINNHYGIY